MTFQFKAIQLDVLKEIGNIGAGNSATALSQLLNKSIEMKVPHINIVPFCNVAECVGGPDEVVVTVFIRLKGDITGNMFFILGEKEARRLLHSIQGVKWNREWNEWAFSILHEVGNILSGSYITALADFTNLHVQPTVPQVAIDMAGAVLNHGLIELGKVGDNALLIETVLLDGPESNLPIKGHFFLLPDPDSFSKIFSTLGVL